MRAALLTPILPCVIMKKGKSKEGSSHFDGTLFDRTLPPCANLGFFALNFLQRFRKKPVSAACLFLDNYEKGPILPGRIVWCNTTQNCLLSQECFSQSTKQFSLKCKICGLSFLGPCESFYLRNYLWHFYKLPFYLCGLPLIFVVLPVILQRHSMKLQVMNQPWSLWHIRSSWKSLLLTGHTRTKATTYK